MVYVLLVFAFRGSRKCSNNKWDVKSAYGSISTKAVYFTQLSDSLIIQLNIFKYIDDISKKFMPNLSIDEEISPWGNRMVLSGTVYHEGDGEQSHCEGLICDTRILRQQKLQCSSKDISVPYILIYKKRISFLVVPPKSLNGTAGYLVLLLH